MVISGGLSAEPDVAVALARIVGRTNLIQDIVEDSIWENEEFFNEESHTD